MFSIRAATQEDRPLIFATWLRAYRHGSHFPRRIPDPLYFAEHHAIAEELLDRSVVRVATPVDDPDVILGWAVFETLEPEASDPTSPVAVHFVYVKPPFRQAGVARALLSPTIPGVEESSGRVFYSHETFPLKLDRIAAHVARWSFNPYLAMRRPGATGNGRNR